MKNTALKVSGIIFLLISFMHILRWAFKIEILAGGFIIPQWISVVAVIVSFILALWMFKSSR